MSQRSDADRVLHEAMMAATGGIEPEAVEHAIADFVRALERQAAVLARANYDARRMQVECPKCGKSVAVTVPLAEPEAVAKAASLTARAGDIVLRLVEFAKGRPDSRPASGPPAWLADLEPEQLVTLQGWIAAAQTRRGRAS